MYYTFLAHLMQNNEYSKFATPIKSVGRIYKEKTSSLRSPYQRDRDRIIHSTAFRRLKHKTQVFVNTAGDHYRTRITHSLEVSQIARTLGKIFKLNEDLCETLSLAHDLGHPPFAHAGEESLNECMDDFGGFDHNIQTLRIITLLERKYYNFKGLNLSIETLDGLIKHNGPVLDKFKYDKILGKKIFKKKNNFLNKPSLESQISSISDDIAYNSHDLEDGLKAGLFKIEELNGIPIISDIIYKHKKKLNSVLNNDIIEFKDVDLINDLERLCAIIDSLDYEITIDNINAQISGALGIKTFVITSYNNENFIFSNLNKAKCDWYPSMNVNYINTNNLYSKK